MDTILMLSFAVLGIVIGAGFFWFLNKNRKNEGGNQSFLMLQEQLKDIRNSLDNKMGESTKIMQSQFSESAKIIRDVTERLTKLDETNRQVVNFADQLQNLQDILKNPKQRGVLGEYYLETLLKNVMPPGSYKMQYKLGKDEEGSDLIPDAVVFVKDKIIPIDSKFSLENYNRLSETNDVNEKARLEKIFTNDLKNRITETSKYIQPNMGTLDFAFMFIPHEAIYYDLLISRVGSVKTDETENLIQRAASKYKVIIVSPTSFLAYLQTVLQGLRAMQIEEQAVSIIGKVGDLGKHLKVYEEYYAKLGSSIGTVVNHYTSAGKEFKKIDKDVLKITGVAQGLEVPALERPAIDDES